MKNETLMPNSALWEGLLLGQAREGHLFFLCGVRTTCLSSSLIALMQKQMPPPLRKLGVLIYFVNDSFYQQLHEHVLGVSRLESL